MALFSRNKDPKADKKARADKKEVAEEAAKTPEQSRALPTDRNLASVLVKPRITEKAVRHSEKNVYTFEVRRDATKQDVLDAVTALFNVTPVKVNIVNKSPRSYMKRAKGRVVSEKGMKKAYVYLKDGDSISLV